MYLSIILDITLPIVISIWSLVALIMIAMFVSSVCNKRKKAKQETLEKNQLEEPKVRQPKSLPKSKTNEENSIYLEEKQVEKPQEKVITAPVSRSAKSQEPTHHPDGTEIEYVDVEKAPIFVVMYNKSFRSKISMGTEECRSFYQDLKSYALSYGLKSRVSWSYETIYIGRVPFARFSVRGKTLSMNIALNPEGYEGGMYEDSSDLKKYADVPLRIKIRSNRTVKLAKNAIDLLAQERGYVQKEIQPVELEPIRSLKENLRLELVKKLKVKRAVSLDSISAEDLEDLEISTEAEENIKQVIKTKKRVGKKDIINIDTISNNYEANEIVTIESLISKKLISSKVQSVKCLARGILDKPLVFQLNDYSQDAIKMILATNGKIE